jgi:hypothetical protein
MRFQNAVEKTRQRSGGKSIHRGDGGLTTRKPLQRLDMGFDPLMALQRFAHVCDQHLAGRGQPQAPRHAFEDRGAELIFQRQDLPIDRGGSHVKP